MDAETKDLTNALRQNAGITIALGLAITIFGALAILTPFLTGAVVTLIVGVLMIAAGITRGIFAFKAQTFGKGLLMFVLGAVVAIGGLFVLARPLIGLASLTMVLAAFFLVDGVMEVAYAFRLRPAKGWGWLVLSGIVSGLLGVFIMYQWPFSGAWAIGILVGVRLIFTGWSVIALGASARGVIDEAESAIDASA